MLSVIPGRGHCSWTARSREFCSRRSWKFQRCLPLGVASRGRDATAHDRGGGAGGRSRLSSLWMLRAVGARTPRAARLASSTQPPRLLLFVRSAAPRSPDSASATRGQWRRASASGRAWWCTGRCSQLVGAAVCSHRCARGRGRILGRRRPAAGSARSSTRAAVPLRPKASCTCTSRTWRKPSQRSSTSVPPCGPAALRPCGPAALRPCGPAALRPCGPAALRPCGPAALRPCASRRGGAVCWA
jgi:hypothetical protein